MKNSRKPEAMQRRLTVWLSSPYITFLVILTLTSCTKTLYVKLPDSTQQIVVDGSIENGAPPIIMLTKSQEIFANINLNDISNYFVHGATVNVTGSDGSHVQLQEFCLKSLSVTPAQAQQLLMAFGLTSSDTSSVPDVCVYTVPDIFNYVTGGTTVFSGKVNTTYFLDIVAAPLYGTDSVHATSSTYIPTPTGLDSLVIRPHQNPAYRDSMVAVYAYFTVPDTFGNFIRYKTKRNSEPFYAPLNGSVYDDKLFIGKSLGVPLERGQPPTADFDINTDDYFWKGDTVTVRWSNIDNNTYNFFYTLQNDGGGSPFSQPVKILSNIHNGLGVWGGYGTKYYTIIIPPRQ